MNLPLIEFNLDVLNNWHSISIGLEVYFHITLCDCCSSCKDLNVMPEVSDISVFNASIWFLSNKLWKYGNHDINMECFMQFKQLVEGIP